MARTNRRDRSTHDSRVEPLTTQQPPTCPSPRSEPDLGDATLLDPVEIPQASWKTKVAVKGRALAILTLLSILSVRVLGERLPMRLYTTADGLWSGYINYMMRDSRGFLWFCTRDGLSRFDGYRFTNYIVADDPPSQNFEYMYESRAGIFWIILSG